MTLHLDDLRVRRLGECRYDSPFSEMLSTKRTSPHYVAEGDRVLLEDTVSMLAEHGLPADLVPSFEAAGPRRKIYFDPARVTAGIVSCGGLCPGLNNVIRGLVQELAVYYEVKRILGFRNGLQGLTAERRYDTIELTPDRVRDIHNDGGTILGTSRGGQDADEMVDSLVLRGVDIMFVIGGDGGMRAATVLGKAIRSRGLDIAVIGIPKTIDNDLPFTDQSFGFQSAFARATDFISSVSVEAAASPNGVGIVKLMGRHSGFIASYAALAANAADIVLIPEIPFVLGERTACWPTSSSACGPRASWSSSSPRGQARTSSKNTARSGTTVAAPTPRATSSSATSRNCSKSASPPTCFRPAWSPRCATSTRVTRSAASPPTLMTASTACVWPMPRCMPPWRVTPKPPSRAGDDASCTSRCH